MFVEKIEKERDAIQCVSLQCVEYEFCFCSICNDNACSLFMTLFEGWWSSILAGSIAGLSILALDDSNRRRTLALYLLARLAQVCEQMVYNLIKFLPATLSNRNQESFVFILLVIMIFHASLMVFVSYSISVLIILQSRRTSFTFGEAIGGMEILYSLLLHVHR